MSFLGCIGDILAGSGLQYLLEQVYAANTVKHMLTGKAYSRAVRMHLLVAAALHTMITSVALNMPFQYGSLSTHTPQAPPQSTEVVPVRQLEATFGSQEPDEETPTQHFVTEVHVAEKSVDACSEADKFRAITATGPDIEIASAELSNSDLRYMLATDNNLVADMKY